MKLSLKRWFWLGCLGLIGSGVSHAIERPLDRRIPDPAANYMAFHYQWGSEWGGVLDAMWGGKIFLDSVSSQPKGFLSKLYDGNPGDLANITGTFLIFDGPHAGVHVSVPSWRRVHRFDFYALESASKTQAKASLAYVRDDGSRQAIRLVRKPVSQKRKLALVAYQGQLPRDGLTHGEFVLSYDNPDLASAFVSEIVLDGMGVDPVSRNKREASNNKCPEAERVEMRGAMTCLHNELTSTMHPAQADLVFWERFSAKGESAGELHSLIVKVNRTGRRYADLAPVWLAYPGGIGGGKVPMVLLLNDSDSAYSSLELLGLDGRPEYALAPAFVDAGMAVMVIEPPPRGTKDIALRVAERIKAAVRLLTRGEVGKTVGRGVDPARIGVVGYGQGATFAMLAAMSDIKPRAVALVAPTSRANADSLPWVRGEADEVLVAMMNGVQGEFMKSAVIRSTLVLGDIDVMERWGRERSSAEAPRIRGMTQAVLGWGERSYLIRYMADQLEAAGCKVGCDDVAELPRRPSEMRPYMERELSRRIELMDAWYIE